MLQFDLHFYIFFVADVTNRDESFGIKMSSSVFSKSPSLESQQLPVPSPEIFPLDAGRNPATNPVLLPVQDTRQYVLADTLRALDRNLTNDSEQDPTFYPSYELYRDEQAQADVPRV